jgi:hypothetical protein
MKPSHGRLLWQHVLFLLALLLLFLLLAKYPPQRPVLEDGLPASPPPIAR